MNIGQFPITRASFMLLRSCNLSCPFCFNHKGLPGSMSIDIAKRGVDFLFKGAEKCQGVERQVEVSFWGGEPLLEWNLLKEITLYAEEVSKKTSIPVQFGGTTNGTLLIPEYFSFLDEHKIFFMISIDGSEETHDLFRKFKSGGGSHSTVLKNVDAVLKKWPFYKARLSPTAERADHFFEDMKYLFNVGFTSIMFSPVYEGTWTGERWQIFEEQCYKLIDYMEEQQNIGRRLEVEHFKSYIGIDNSNRACGAGVFYANIDIDGSIEICHRFRKFNDPRPWKERPYCIGHIDHGITRPDVKAKFENPDHSACGDCLRLTDCPCHGGCPAVNTDFTGNPFIPYKGLCKYVEIQKKVSEYYASKLPINPIRQGSCICDNMCYAENTPNEIITLNPNSGDSCICNMTKYTGPTTQGIANPLNPKYGGMHG